MNRRKEAYNGSMRRNIKKSLWMSKEEEWDLKQKAQAACLTESEFIRQRIKGYVPPHKIDDRFWNAMEVIREFADRIDQIAMESDKPPEAVAIMAEAKKWRMFQNAIEMEFLRPKRGDG